MGSLRSLLGLVLILTCFAAGVSASDKPTTSFVLRYTYGPEGDCAHGAVDLVQVSNNSDLKTAAGRDALIQAVEGNLQSSSKSCYEQISDALYAARRRARKLQPIEISRIERDAALACDWSCGMKACYAIAHYRRIARNPTRLDQKAIVEGACGLRHLHDGSVWCDFNMGSDTLHGTCPEPPNWRAQQLHPGERRYSSLHPNWNVPIFGVTYNGWGGPFDMTGYMLYRPQHNIGFFYLYYLYQMYQ